MNETDRTSDGNMISDELLRIAAQLVLEIHPNRSGVPVHLETRLDQDLGLGSLGRMELISRIERSFDVSLPEELPASAETIHDLLRALSKAPGRLRSARITEERQNAPEAADIVPDSVSTLLEVLEWHYRTHPERTHIILYDDAEENDKISYAALREGAEKVAGGLLKRGLEARQTVAIMLPTSPEYFYVFFGILLAGGIPVPIYPPARLSQIEDHLRRHTGILANAQVSMMITVPEARSVAWLLKSGTAGLHTVLVPQELIQSGGKPPYIIGKDIRVRQHRQPEGGRPDPCQPSGQYSRHGPGDRNFIDRRVRELAAAVP